MRIGIDASCWSNRRGFGRFTRELVTRMVADHPRHRFTLLADEPTVKAGDFPAGAQVVAVATGQKQTEAAAADGNRSPGDLWRMARAASRLSVDLFFFPAVYSYFPLLRRVPTVVTFHDAIAEQHPALIFPGWRSRLFWNAKTWLARRQADCVLTVSQAAKRQIVEAFGVPERRIAVISEGPGEGFGVLQDRAPVDAVLRKYDLPIGTPLLLYVGGISPHKNLQGLLRALDRLRATSHKPWHMVIVGDYKGDAFYGCYAELEALCSGLSLRGHVSFTGFVPNADLVALYNASAVLVLPSFSEGFGLPVVEAMTCGVPVACSRAGSLPEVLGDAGLSFDPRDEREMAAVLRRLLEEDGLLSRLRQQGLTRAEAFSWTTAARDTVRLFEQMRSRAVASR